MIPRRALASLLVFALVIAHGAPASAYVKTRTRDGNNPLFWTNSCIYLLPDARGSDDITDDSVLAAIQASADAWNNVGCSYLRFVIEPPEHGVQAEFNQTGSNENVIVFQEEKWPYDSSAAGLTTLTYIASDSASRDGEVVDADVELNGVNFTFGTDAQGNRHDVQNVLTHELGHVLGLDHTCDDGLVVPTPTDHTGATIPGCYPAASLPAAITEATMYNYASPGETQKRILSADDSAGLCALYPLEDDPGKCEKVSYEEPGPCNCNTHEGLPAGLLLWGLFLVPFLVLRRRRHVRPK